MKKSEVYDCIIVGGGPAGLSAAIYALRAGLKVLLLEKYVFGGQTNQTSVIENYPGFFEISGAELSEKMFLQAQKFGLEYKFDEVVKMDLKKQIKEVVTISGSTYFGRGVILSMGAYARKLNIKDEKKLLGKGISYCATCDGSFFKGKNVAVVGGGNSAVTDAIYLSQFCKNVYLIHRRDELKADEILQKSLKQASAKNGGKILPVFSSVVTGLYADETLKQIKIKNVQTQKEVMLYVDGLFIAIGKKPDTEILEDQIELDKNGFVVVDQNMQTNIEGVFAAGDVTNKKLKQIVTATADGAIAATSLRPYLSKQKST